MAKMEHFEIPVDDIARAQAFYRGVLGLPLVHAASHARAFVTAYGRRSSLADSLSLRASLLHR